MRIPLIDKNVASYETDKDKKGASATAAAKKAAEQVEQTKPSSVTGWVRGRIKRILTIEEAKGTVKIADNARAADGQNQDEIERNVLHVVFPELPERFDMYIDRWSTNIARAGTFTSEEYTWKN